MSEIRLMEYQGKYRIEQGNFSKDRNGDEKWWPEKIRKQVWNKETKVWEFEDKNRNFSMSLGDYDKARATIDYLMLELGELESMRLPKGVDREQPPLEDIPF